MHAGCRYEKCYEYSGYPENLGILWWYFFFNTIQDNLLQNRVHSITLCVCMEL